VNRWLFIVSGVLLAGCARFELRPLSPGESAERLQSRTLDNPELKSFLEDNLQHTLSGWPARSWSFEMLTLAAFYYQPGIEVARAHWRVAQAEIKTAGGRPNPTLTAGPGYNSSALSGVNPWMPFATLDVPIETAGKRGHRITRAEHLSEAARLNITAAAWQLRSNVRATLLDFVAARRREELLLSQASLQRQIIQSLEQRQQAGAISSAEVGVVRVSFAKTQTELADAQRQSAEARARVAEAVAVPLSALSDIELSFELTNFPPTGELVSTDARRQALQSRADILGGLAEYAASQSALQLEIAKQYPDVHLSPGYQWDQGENKWQLGLSVELPVLNRNQGPIAEAAARRAESAARFEALQAKVLAEIDRAVAMLAAGRQNLEALQSLSAAQKARRESVEAQIKAGAAERLDLLNAQFESAASVLAELDAQVKWQQAFGALEDAVQRPLNMLLSQRIEPSPRAERSRP
jgi:outer membrane protein TolC